MRICSCRTLTCRFVNDETSPPLSSETLPVKPPQIRSLLLCAVWLAFTFNATVVALFQPSPAAEIICWLIVIYCVQAFFAEALGVRADRSAVSFPRRPLMDFPLLVLWRERIACAEIDQIGSWSNDQIRFHKSSGERVKRAFDSRAAKLQFFESVRRANPFIEISRYR